MSFENFTLSVDIYEAGLNSGGSQAKQNSEFGFFDDLPAGWEVVGPGGRSVSYGRLVEEDGIWKFELTAPLQHNNTPGEDSSLTHSEKPTVIVRDAAGVQHEIPIEVNVFDDFASIRSSASLKVTSGNEVSSRLTVAYGADEAHSDSPLSIAGGGTPQISGDVAIYTLEHGTVELNTATGAYTFKANGISDTATSVQQSITFVAKDGDGDLAERTVEITINKPPMPNITLESFVDEAGMDNGGSQAQSNSEYGGFNGLPQGWTVVGAGGTNVPYGEVVCEGGTWFFKLTEAVSHTEAGLGDTLVHTDSPTVLIQDAKGNTYEIPVSITIADDAATLGGDKTVSVKGGSTLEGDLTAIYGADGPGTGGKIALAGVSPDSVNGDIAVYATPMGVLTLNTATGHYSFEAASLAPGEQRAVERLSFVMVDADGDTATLDVDVTINAAAPPAWLRLTSSVNEAGLEGGQWESSDSETGKLVGLPAGWLVISSGPGVDYGNIVEKNGVWSFELTKALEHSGGVASLKPQEKPFVIVEDPDGVRYEVPVSVTVKDDAPDIFSLADEYVERYGMDIAPVTVSGFLEMAFGADGAATADAFMWDTSLLEHLTSKGQPIELEQSNGLLTATVHDKVVFTLSLQADGGYEYTQYRHIDSTSELAFSLTLKDADGNESTVDDVLIVHIDTDVSDQPDVVSPEEDDRFVLYTDGSAGNIDGKAIAGNVLANDNDPDAMMVSVSNGTYGKAVIDVHGEVRYTLNAGAASRMPGGTDPVFDQLTYTAIDSNGNRYERTIEIVINRENVSDEIYISDNKINGETHQSHISIEGDYMKHTPEIVGSDGSDKFTVNGSIGYATVSMGQGDNSVTISPGSAAAFALKRSTLLTEDGNDDIRISGYTDTSTINMGDGNNVFIASSATNGTTTLNDTSLIMGDGDDRVRITNTVGDSLKTTLGAMNFWSTKLFASPTADTGGTLDHCTAIDLGGGNNLIEVVVNPEKTHTGIYQGGYTLHDVYYDPYSALNNGSTITSKSGAGEFTTVLIDSSAHGIVNNSHVYVQGGNADITVNTFRDTSLIYGGNLTLGLYNGSSIETADGQDTIRFNSTGYAMYTDSHIITGDGDKQISLYSSGTQTVMHDGCSVQTGTGNDTIALTTDTIGGEVLYQKGAAVYDTSAYAVLMGSSFIDAGAGKNDISVTSSMATSIYYNNINGYGVWGYNQARTVNLSAYAINDNSGIKAGLGTTDAQKITVSSTTNGIGNGSYILSGAGDDTISLTAGSAAAGNNKYALYNGSFINAGNGNNMVTVSSEDYGMSGMPELNSQGSYATGDYYPGGSKILTGSGDDTISLTVTGRAGHAMQYSSNINAGEGNNVITVTNNSNVLGYFGIVANSGVTAGNGDNTINVSSWVQALQDHSYIRVGDGDNIITLTGKAYNASYGLMVGESVIYAGNGHNAITVTGPGNAIQNSSILAGDGGNTITVTATQGTALYNDARIVTGAGDDAVIVSGVIGVASKSEIHTGIGSDTVSITATGQQALHSALLDTEAGNDLITLTGAMQAAYASIIETGAGDDTINIISTNSLALQLTTLNAGAGDDMLNVSSACAAGDARGLLASHVAMGDGSDTVSIAVTGKNAAGMYSQEANTTLSLGNADDVLDISAVGSIYGSALLAHNTYNIIDAGSGDDSILLTGNQYALHVTGTGTNSILCGSGDDTVTLDGFVGGPAGQNLIDGGVGGQDELRLLLDGTGTANMALLNGIATNATVTNIENIVLDLFGRTEDTLLLTQEHLDNLAKSGWATPNAMEAGGNADLYVNGTDYDTLNLSGTDGSWQLSGTTLYNGETYNHWISSANQDIFVMQEILVITT